VRRGQRQVTLNKVRPKGKARHPDMKELASRTVPHRLTVVFCAQWQRIFNQRLRWLCTGLHKSGSA
jgi:hypothetical protein